MEIKFYYYEWRLRLRELHFTDAHEIHDSQTNLTVIERIFQFRNYLELFSKLSHMVFTYSQQFLLILIKTFSLNKG